MPGRKLPVSADLYTIHFHLASEVAVFIMRFFRWLHYFLKLLCLMPPHSLHIPRHFRDYSAIPIQLIHVAVFEEVWADLAWIRGKTAYELNIKARYDAVIPGPQKTSARNFELTCSTHIYVCLNFNRFLHLFVVPSDFQTFLSVKRTFLVNEKRPFRTFAHSYLPVRLS